VDSAASTRLDAGRPTARAPMVSGKRQVLQRQTGFSNGTFAFGGPGGTFVSRIYSASAIGLEN